MQMVPTIGGVRRGRRRLVGWRLLTLATLVAAFLTGMLASYRVGMSQSRNELERLHADLATQHDLNRLMSERAAAAQERAEAAITRAAQLQQLQRSLAPTPELQRLMAAGEERLRAGLTVDRLEFLLRQASVAQACAKEIDTRRVVVHTPISTGSIGSVGFADNRITVTSEGAAARTVGGLAAARFDSGRPVTLRFLRIDGDVSTVVGRLPLTHVVVVGDTEFRFSVHASQQQPDAVELSAQRCAFP
jgi:hypothetical protein